MAGRFRSGLWSGFRGRSLSDVTLGAVLHAGGSVGQWRSTAGPNGAATKRGMLDPRRGKARTGWVSRSEDRKSNQGESLLGGAAEPIFRHTREGGCPCFGGLGVSGSDRGASIGGRCLLDGCLDSRFRGNDGGKGTTRHKTKRPPQGSGRFTDRVAPDRITYGSRVCRRPGRLP